MVKVKEHQRKCKMTDRIFFFLREPLADMSNSPCIHDHALRVVSWVSALSISLVCLLTNLQIDTWTHAWRCSRPTCHKLSHHIFPGSIWERFPYLLPNLVCTVIVSVGVVVGILFLEETHEEKKYRRDPGLEAGKWLVRKFASCRESNGSRGEKNSDPDEVVSLLSEDEQPPGYRTREGSPRLAATPSPEPQDPLDLNDANSVFRSKPAVTKAFTRQVVLNIVGYGILA